MSCGDGTQFPLSIHKELKVHEVHKLISLARGEKECPAYAIRLVRGAKVMSHRPNETIGTFGVAAGDMIHMVLVCDAASHGPWSVMGTLTKYLDSYAPTSLLLWISLLARAFLCVQVRDGAAAAQKVAFAHARTSSSMTGTAPDVDSKFFCPHVMQSDKDRQPTVRVDYGLTNEWLVSCAEF